MSLNMGFLSSLKEIHFPTGTGPTGPKMEPYNVSLSFFFGITGEIFFNDTDYWITLATYKGGANVGIDPPLTSAGGTITQGIQAGVTTVEVNLGNITNPLSFLLYSDFLGFPTTDPYNASFTAQEVAGRRRTATCPLTNLGFVGSFPGNTHPFALQIVGIGIDFTSGIGALGTAGTPVGVDAVIT